MRLGGEDRDSVRGECPVRLRPPSGPGVTTTFGQLGNGTRADSSVPVRAHLNDVTAVAAGKHHVLALGPTGAVWAWGDNLHGELTFSEFGLEDHVKAPDGLLVADWGRGVAYRIQAHGRP